jgi:hypothetical protein
VTGAAGARARARRLRRWSVAGAVATLGLFTGLAAGGGHGGSTAEPAATTPGPAAAPETPAPAPSEDYFDPYAPEGVSPGSSSGPADAQSGVS